MGRRQEQGRRRQREGGNGKGRARVVRQLELERVAGFRSHGARYSSRRVERGTRGAGVGGRERRRRRAELLAAGDLAHHVPSRAAGRFGPARRRRQQQPGLVALDHAAQRVGALHTRTYVSSRRSV